MAEVSIQEVSRVFPGGVFAVNRLSLEIEDGELLVLTGPAGAGKSTLLRMIAGLEEISEGSISIGGREVNDVPPKSREIAMLFKNFALYPHMSVYKNMAFGLNLRHLSPDELDCRVREAAQILGIEDLLDRNPKLLSGGQRQRVALGRAVVRHPAVFLFDEPLCNLDAKLRVQMRTEILNLHKRLKTTMIYATHDQVEAEGLAGRIVEMQGGAVQRTLVPALSFSDLEGEGTGALFDVETGASLM